MALNEITKGMSNAAEMINQNFKSATIVDSGTSERGSYIKFGNGFYIQFIKFTHDRAASTDRVNYLFPLTKNALGAVVNTATGVGPDGFNINNTIIYPYTGQFFRYAKAHEAWEGTNNFPATATVWGFE